MTEGNPEAVRRRRRTRRHRRNRLVRRALWIGSLAVFVAGCSAVALHYLSPSLFQSARNEAPSSQDAEVSRERLLQTNEATFESNSEARPVYPYSVIRGGVEDVRELKWVAEHDPVVAAHYAGFDYDHAHIVRLTLAQTVFVSYRIGNHVYWTRHRIKLHKGEKLLTDGKITARTKCGNRVETIPQQAASESEPPAVKFEEPMGGGLGSAMQGAPVPFQSALLDRRGAPGIGPAPPLSLFSPFEEGHFDPIAPPPLPRPGVCEPGKKKGTGEIGGNGTKKRPNPCGPPESVPEPWTWVLMATGLSGISLLKMREKRQQYEESARLL